MASTWLLVTLSAFVPPTLAEPPQDDDEFISEAAFVGQPDPAAQAVLAVQTDPGVPPRPAIRAEADAPSPGDAVDAPDPRLKFLLIPHVTLLHLADAGGRAADRTGGGVAMMFAREASFDFEVLPRKDGDARSYLFTLAAACFSDFQGSGRRHLLNPYLGVRLGGAKMNGFGAFAYGADAGVELVRFRLFLVEASASAIGLWYNRHSAPTSDLLLAARLGVGVPW